MPRPAGDNQNASNHKMASLKEIEDTVFKCINSDVFNKKIVNAVKPILDEFYVELKKNTSSIKSHQNKIERLEKQLKRQENDLNTLQKKLNSKDRHERLLTLRISGLPEDKQQAKDQLKTLAKDKMSMQISMEEKEITLHTVRFRQNEARKPPQSDVINGETPQKTTTNRHMSVVRFANIWQRRMQIFCKLLILLKSTPCKTSSR